MFASFPSRCENECLSLLLEVPSRASGVAHPLGHDCMGKGMKKNVSLQSLCLHILLAQRVLLAVTSKHRYTCPEELWVGRHSRA